MSRRVVVTGMGAITPIGNNVEEFWKGIMNEQIGFGEITQFDTTDYKVKYRKSGNWFDLSVDDNGSANTNLQDAKSDLVDSKVVIGKDGATDDTPGILVLSDADKAMVLPLVYEPHLNIKNPTAGTMVYDTKNRQLVLYNGTNWSFWKP